MDSGIFNYIDFFSGCGGLSLGLGSSGWNGVFAIEIDPMAFQTFKQNLIDSKSIRHHFNSWPEWLSVEPHAIEDVLEDPSIRSNLLSLSGKIMLVAGGPPCQGFSVAGARNGKDPRNLLVFKQIEAIKILSAYQELMRKNVSSLEIPTSHRFNKHSAKIIDLIKLAQ